MEHLEYPPRALWDARRDWFELQDEEFQGMGGYVVSEQACALIAEVQAVFCAGAWIAVIILVMSVVDAQLRETEVPDFSGSTCQLLNMLNVNKDLQHLRKRRNALVHIDHANPAITVDQQWLCRKQLENEARNAVRLMFEAFYSNPFV